jgi:hypothetical protein
MWLSPDTEQGVNASAIQIVDAVLVVLAITLLGIGHAMAVAAGGATGATYTVLWLASAALAVLAVLTAGRMRPAAGAPGTGPAGVPRTF